MRGKIIATAILVGTGFLFAQFLDNHILNCVIDDKRAVLISPNGINWRGETGGWKALSGVSAVNAVIGQNDFAVRLFKEGGRVTFLHGNFVDNVSRYETTTEESLYGHGGAFRQGKFYFALGNRGIAVLDNTGAEIVEQSFFVNSISSSYRPYNLIALSPDGKVFGGESVENLILRDSLKLKRNEEAMMFVEDFSNNSVLVLAVDRNNITNNTLYRWREGKLDTLDSGDIMSLAVSNDKKFIYIIESSGNLIVRDINGADSDSARVRIRARKDILQRRLNKSNATANFILKDISVSGNSLAFASDKGFFFSSDEGAGIRNELPFEFENKPVRLDLGLREVYAEPGIITAKDKFATFEYSLSEKDNVTIDIFNYNLDFVCRIVESALRFPATTVNERSTDRQEDRWDGTINNRGGRTVSPGVYYFKITTMRGKSAVGKIIVAR